MDGKTFSRGGGGLKTAEMRPRVPGGSVAQPTDARVSHIPESMENRTKL